MKPDRSMKLSAAVAIFILLVFGLAGWKDRTRGAALEEERRVLRKHAEQAGIAVETGANPGRRTKVLRDEHRTEQASDLPKRFVALLKQVEDDGDIDEEQAMRLIDDLALLDPAGMEILLKEAEANLKEKTMQQSLAIGAMALGGDFPAEALALLERTSDLDLEEEIPSEFLGATLGELAKKNPRGAMEWLQANRGKNPDMFDNDVKLGLIGGTAVSDPELAFAFINELDVDLEDAVKKIASAGAAGADRAKVIQALRNEMAREGDPDTRESLREMFYQNLAGDALDEGITESAKWLEQSRLSAEEMDAFSDGLASGISSSSGDPSRARQWIEWMGKAPPTGTLSRNLALAADQWTRTDYRAVEQWLDTQPEGPLKNSVRKGYELGMEPTPEEAAISRKRLETVLPDLFPPEEE